MGSGATHFQATENGYCTSPFHLDVKIFLRVQSASIDVATAFLILIFHFEKFLVKQSVSAFKAKASKPVIYILHVAVVRAAPATALGYTARIDGMVYRLRYLRQLLFL